MVRVTGYRVNGGVRVHIASTSGLLRLPVTRPHPPSRSGAAGLGKEVSESILSGQVTGDSCR
jgi:hypothetical protein